MLALITIPTINVMGNIPQDEEENKINLEYSIFNEDGTQTIEQIYVNENEIASFNEIIEKIIENITSTDNYNIIEIIQNLQEKFGKNTILSTILGIRPLQKRVFIISNGYGPKFDIRLRRDIAIHKIFNLWYYPITTSYTITSKTLIIDPIPNAQLQFYRLIQGQQIGLMTRFTGFYLRIPSNIKEQTQSHTFIIGYAVKVRAFDLPDPEI
jgi:competence CoiA-like predicted nuclease